MILRPKWAPRGDSVERGEFRKRHPSLSHSIGIGLTSVRILDSCATINYSIVELREGVFLIHNSGCSAMPEILKNTFSQLYHQNLRRWYCDQRGEGLKRYNFLEKYQPNRLQLIQFDPLLRNSFFLFYAPDASFPPFSPQ